MFFLRGHSDTDNIVPAIWFLLEDNASAIVDVIYYRFEFPFLSHPYVTALLARFGDRVKLSWVGSFLGLDYEELFQRKEVSPAEATRMREQLDLDWSQFHRVFKAHVPAGRRQVKIRYRLWGHGSQRAMTLSMATLSEASSHFSRRSPHISQALRQAFIKWVVAEQTTPNLALFGYQRGRSLAGLFDALRSVGVDKVVRLPISPMINVNVLRQPNYVVPNREEIESMLDFTGFDAVSYTDHIYPENLRKLFLEMGWGDPLQGKLAVLGAIRYCPEWIAVRPKPPAFASPNDDGRTKIAVFLSRVKTNTDWHEVRRTFCILESFPSFHVIVQPHPRDPDVADVVGKNVEVRTDVPSPSLIAWADIVMLWGSSIGLEALLQNKTLLCPTYLNANRNAYEMFGGGWMLRCRDDLVMALAKLQRDPSARTYDNAGVDRLINEIVFAGDREPVPARYLDFIRQNEKNSD